ncbi:hypothetical protein [Apibacter sp. HY039]|uniref:hypothetical protein n=1 Tax=Apibacter sp. HY039 TaxID=2501476 RepID=UPI000FEB983E|nr:hypothetical protein [Apibacter sp. HY039]
MPLPQLGLSLSITDSAGSPMYAGNGEREKMSEFDSALTNHTITITITDDKVNEVELDIHNDQFDKIKLPTYKMMVTDDKTEERTFYEVTRDSFLMKELKSKEVGGFTFFGINMFKKTVYSLPVVTFEPLKSTMEIFEVSKYRTKRENYLLYTLRRNSDAAVLVSGNLPKETIENINTEHFFYVVDHNEGQKFIGDISYREKFIKTIPKVEIHLIKRSEKIKEYELDKKGKVNKIIYL